MFENVPIKKRWKFILGIIAFAFTVSFVYAWQVKGIYQKVDELQARTAIVEDADLEIVNRQVRLKELGDEIRGLQSTGREIDSHVQLMQYIEEQCDQKMLQLIQLPKESIEDADGYEIARIEFSVQGNFSSILGLIYQIEAIDRIGSISKAGIELKSMRVEDELQQLLIATIHMNRLVTPKPKSTHFDPQSENS